MLVLLEGEIEVKDLKILAKFSQGQRGSSQLSHLVKLSGSVAAIVDKFSNLRIENESLQRSQSRSCGHCLC